MKRIVIIIAGTLVAIAASVTVFAQADGQRMERDIEVVENVLSTLLRQQFDKQHMFFPLEVKGSYQPGYGVTFRLPADFTTPIVFTFDGMDGLEEPLIQWKIQEPPSPPAPGVSGNYSYVQNNEIEEDNIQIEQRTMKVDREEAEKQTKSGIILKEKTLKDKEKLKKKSGIDKERLKEKRIANLDSVRDSYNDKMISASKDFLADYGDLLSQLSPTEKIVITNQGEQPHVWVGKLMNAPNRTNLSIEVSKADITQYKQAKISRSQFMNKIKIVDTEAIESVEPDIELLSSIFDRLYQIDLSKNFFTEDNIYFERLKDYGVVYYMQVFSSKQQDYDRFAMPTVKLSGLDQQARNKKVVELYPEFEKELKENILEYGRTVKSLKDTEVLIFNVKLTKCPECGIPSSLELSIKASVLKEYSTGKIDKNLAVSKLIIKKGAGQ